MKSDHFRIWQKIGGVAYGGDYNPEQWPEDTWQDDIALMKHAGVNLVSLGIFSWASLQFGPDDWQFEWLDKVMDLLARADISVLLATSTASPPPWLTKQYPDILPITFDGLRLYPGGRQHYCPSSQSYRTAAHRLVEALAKRYGQHPALAGWHVGNEYGCHVAQCYCDESAADFRRWLKKKYGTVEALNQSWSTSFWSQRYQDWEEVLPPRLAPTFANPAQQLDFHRFSSDALMECFSEEVNILKEITSGVPVTTNFMGLFKPLDYFAWARHEDFVSHDSYPDPVDPESPVIAALAFDFMRSVGKGRPWLLMEQAPSAVNWRERNRPKRPQLYRLWSHQALAHGANGVMSFQWRASRGGAEKFHSGMVPHAGADTRIYREVVSLGEELRDLKDVISTTSRSDVALAFDWSSWWGLELDSHPSNHVKLPDLMLRYYRPLWKATIPVDIVHPNWDLSTYKIVFIPNLYLVDDSTAHNLQRFVENGGHLVVSFFSGIVNGDDIIHQGGYPGPLKELLGIRVEEFWPLEEKEEMAVTFDDGRQYSASLWGEIIHADKAEIIARFATGELARQPVVTRCRVGSGTSWYVGTRMNEDGLTHLINRIVNETGVRGIVKNAPGTIEATVRQDGKQQFVFLLNHSSQPATVELALDHTRPPLDVLSGQVNLGPVILAPSEARILRLN